MFESVQDIVEVHDQTAEGCQELQYDNGTQLICASFELPGVEDHEQPADMVQELQHADGLQSICANLELAGNMLLNSFDKQLDLGVGNVAMYYLCSTNFVLNILIQMSIVGKLS
jgi:hypothetical protein